MKIRDFASVQTHFDELVKTMSTPRAKAIIDAQGGVPRFFVKVLCDLEDFIEDRKKDKAAFKKLSATQGRALNRMGLVLKKHNKQYEKLMVEYRANPGISTEEEEDEDAKAQSDDDSDDDDDDSDDSDSDSSRSAAVVTKKTKPTTVVSDSDSNSVRTVHREIVIRSMLSSTLGCIVVWCCVDEGGRRRRGDSI